MAAKPHPTRFPEPGHDHGSCLGETLARAQSAFETKGLKFTPLRRRVLEEIAGSHRAVGAYAILERLAGQSEKRLAPISVYRVLDSLVEAGVVHRLESRNAYFACHAPHPGDRRQIVLACERCSAVVELAGESIFDGLSRAATDAGFMVRLPMVEMLGTCGRCAASGV